MRLELHGVGVVVDGVDLVRDVDLSCAPGDMVGLVGPNGSGKSTVLKTIYRALRPTAGTVSFDGRDLVREVEPRTAAKHIAAFAQEHNADVGFTVAEVVATGRTPHKTMLGRDTDHDRSIVLDALDTVGIRALADRPYRALSGGEKQRVQLGRALAQQPDVLLLDEPTNHLDIATQFDLMELVRGLGISVVTAVHDLNLAARYCDQVHVLREGAVVAAGPPSAVFTEHLMLEVFGVRARRDTDPDSGVVQLTLSPRPVPKNRESMAGGSRAVPIDTGAVL